MDEASLGREFANLVQNASEKFEIHDFRGAIEDCDKAIEINSNYAEVYYLRANAKASMSDFYGAIEDYTNAIEINNPENADAYLFRGRAKASINDFNGAIRDYNKQLEINPELIEAYIFRGNAKATLGDCLGPLNGWTKLLNQFSHLKFRLWENNAEAFLWNRSFKSFRRQNRTGSLKPFVSTIWPTVFFSGGEISSIRAV